MNIQRRLEGKQIRTHWVETDEPQTVYTPHCHEQYEIYCFLSGLADFRLEGLACPLERGSVLLVERSRFHSVQALAALGQPYCRAVIHFDQDALTKEEQYLLGLFRRPEILYPGAWDKGLETGWRALEAAAALPPTVRDIALRTRLMGILLDLYAMSGEAVSVTADRGRVQEVLAWLNANLTTDVTLEELAARFYFSRNGLARAFKHATGTTVAEYVLFKRMALARILLRAGHPAGVVARECGYSEYSTFYRNYCRVYGQNPAALPDPPADSPAPPPAVLAPAPEDM